MGLLHRTAQIAEEYLATLGDRRVGASLGFEDVLASLDGPLPEQGEDAEDVLDALAALEPGTNATAGPRYFGFVTGGALPVTVAADWLVSTWDGPHFGRVVSPAGAAVEDVASRWLLEALGLPARRPRRVRDRRDDGEPGRARRRAPPRARDRRLGRRGAGPGRRAAGADPRRRRGPRLAAEGAAAARLRLGRRGADPGRRQRRDAARARSPRRCARARARRSCARRRATSTRAPATRCCRSSPPRARPARGCTSTARSGCGPPRRRGSPSLRGRRRRRRLVGAGRAQVAQRPLRLRRGDRRRRRGARGRDVRHRRLPAGERRRADQDARDVAPRPPGPGLRRDAPPRPPRDRRARRALLRRTRARLAAAMERVEGAEVLNDVVLNQVLLRFDGDDERTARVIEETAAQRRGVAGRHGLARRVRGARGVLELVDDRRRRRPARGGARGRARRRARRLARSLAWRRDERGGTEGERGEDGGRGDPPGRDRHVPPLLRAAGERRDRDAPGGLDRAGRGGHGLRRAARGGRPARPRGRAQAQRRPRHEHGHDPGQVADRGQGRAHLPRRRRAPGRGAARARRGAGPARADELLLHARGLARQARRAPRARVAGARRLRPAQGAQAARRRPDAGRVAATTPRRSGARRATATSTRRC